MFSQVLSVILSTGGGGRWEQMVHHMHYWIGHMVGYPLSLPRHQTWRPTSPSPPPLPAPPLPPRHQIWDLPPSPATDIWWSSLETCSNLFTWGPNPQRYWHLVQATKTCPVGKQAVCILLQCCLVMLVLYFYLSKNGQLIYIHASGHKAWQSEIRNLVFDLFYPFQ